MPINTNIAPNEPTPETSGTTAITESTTFADFLQEYSQFRDQSARRRPLFENSPDYHEALELWERQQAELKDLEKKFDHLVERFDSFNLNSRLESETSSVPLEIQVNHPTPDELLSILRALRERTPTLQPHSIWFEFFEPQPHKTSTPTEERPQSPQTYRERNTSSSDETSSDGESRDGSATERKEEEDPPHSTQEESSPLLSQEEEMASRNGTQQYLDLVEPFSGKKTEDGEFEEDFDDFVSSVRMAASTWISSLGRITDTDKNFIRMKCLKEGLKGEAASVITEMEKKDRKDYDKVIDALTLRYGDEEEDDLKVEQILEQFRALRQDTMTTVKYIEKAQKLLQKLPKVERDKRLLVGYFLRGLRSEAMIQGATSLLPEKYTMKDAVDAVRKQNRLYEAQEEAEEETRKEKPKGEDGLQIFQQALTSCLQKANLAPRENTRQDETYSKSGTVEQRVVKFQEPPVTPAKKTVNVQAYGRNTSPWCFRCGQQGHLSPSCTSTTEISWQEKRNLQDRIGWTPKGTSNSTTRVVEVNSTRLGERTGFVDEKERDDAQIREVNVAEVWEPTNREIRAWERTNGGGGSRISQDNRKRPVVNATLEDMVEIYELGKRGRGGESSSGGNPEAGRRRRGPMGAQRMSIENLIHPAPSNHRPPTVEDAGRPEAHPVMVKTTLETDKVRELVQKAERREEAKRFAKPKPHTHIKALGDQKPVSPGWILRNVFTRIEGSDVRISLAQWLDVSPGFRAQMARELGKAEKRKHPKRQTPFPQDAPIIGMLEVDGYAQTQGLHRAGPEPPITQRIDNFYTAVTVHLPAGKRAVVRGTLVDGGAMVGIAGESVIKALGLPRQPTPPLFMKSVTDEIVALEYRVNLLFEVAGVLSLHTVYVGPPDATFTLILGRRWLSQVKAVGDYQKETYSIEAADGFRAQLPREVRKGNEGVPHVFRSEEYVRKMLQEDKDWDLAWEEEEAAAAKELLAIMTPSSGTTSESAETETFEEENTDTDSESTTETDYDSPIYDSTIDFSTESDEERPGNARPRR